MDKKIIYGAGKIGEKALKYYGVENIECFIDSNHLKWGKNYCGKKIISLEEYKRQKYKNQIVIATLYNSNEIVKILKDSQIDNFIYFEGGKFEKLEKFFNDNNINNFYNILIYGEEREQLLILDVLKKNNISKYITLDIDNDSLVNNNIIKEKKDLLECINTYNIDCVIVASQQYHIALEIRLQHLLKDKYNIKILNPFKMKTYYPTNELIINPYKENLYEDKKEADVIRRNQNFKEYYKNSVNVYINEIMGYEQPCFKLVEIETYNRCNGSCEFCPVNKNVDTRQAHFMTEKLFYKIISELQEINYNGRISLFSNNEPLLDKRIFKFSKYIRKHLPEATIHMFTNGTLFNVEKFKELIIELDELIIDNYTQDLSLIKPVKEIAEYCYNNTELIKKVSIVLRKPKEILSSRGGEAPNRKVKEIYSGVPCSMPFQQMVIRPTGKVSLCCNDPLGKYTLGDLSNNTIKEIWNGNAYKDIRNLISKGRENIEHCKYCDVFSLYL